MSKYLLIESRDPFDSRDCEWLYNTAKDLKAAGNEVTVFFVQNGVLPTRKTNQYAETIHELAQAKVTLLADSLSLQERAIMTEELLDEVQTADVDALVDLLMEDQVKPLWH